MLSEEVKTGEVLEGKNTYTFSIFEGEEEVCQSPAQTAINWQLWMNWEKYARSYCNQHNDCQYNVDDIVGLAAIKFAQFNRLEHTSKCYVENQCLMAARSLGYYHHNDRKSKYRGEKKPTYTPANLDEAEAIKTVRKGELNVIDAVAYFCVNNPILVEYLEFCADEYYSPKAQTLSLDALLEDKGDSTGNGSYTDDYVLPSLVSQASVMIDVPADHNLASNALRQAKADNTP